MQPLQAGTPANAIHFERKLASRFALMPPWSRMSRDWLLKEAGVKRGRVWASGGGGTGQRRGDEGAAVGGGC